MDYGDKALYGHDGSYMHRWIDREAARVMAWSSAHPVTRIGRTPGVRFTLASIKAWKVDRSSGFLRVVRGETKPKASPAKVYRLALQEAAAALTEIASAATYCREQGGDVLTSASWAKVDSTLARIRNLAA